MPNSLRVKLSKLRYKGQISESEYQELIEKLEGHDKSIRAESRWIPISEKLPKSDEEYHSFLVTDNKGNVTISEFYLSLIDKKPYWSGMINVIAWMPLPEPYKAESEEV